jgi:hypothetical protein
MYSDSNSFTLQVGPIPKDRRRKRRHKEKKHKKKVNDPFFTICLNIYIEERKETQEGEARQKGEDCYNSLYYYCYCYCTTSTTNIVNIVYVQVEI